MSKQSVAVTEILGAAETEILGAAETEILGAALSSPQLSQVNLQ